MTGAGAEDATDRGQILVEGGGRRCASSGGDKTSQNLH